MFLRADTNSVTGAVGRALLSFTRKTAIPAAAMALSLDAQSLPRAVIQTGYARAVDTGERLGAYVRPLLGAIVWSIVRIALAFAINTETMSMTSVLAVQQLTRTPMESLMAVALSVTAHSVI